jgi:hypothetical protein
MVYFDSTLPSYIDPGSYLIISQQNPFKTIIPSGRLEDNASHRVYCVVSPKISLWVDVILRCFPLGNEWRYAVVLCNFYSFNLTSNYNSHCIHACGIPDLPSYFVHLIFNNQSNIQLHALLHIK